MYIITCKSQKLIILYMFTTSACEYFLIKELYQIFVNRIISVMKETEISY